MPDKYPIPTKIFHALMKQLHDAVFVIKNGRFVFVNQRTTELFGFSESELLSCPIFEFVHEDDKELVRNRYKARLNGESVPSAYSFKISTKSGETRKVSINVEIIEDDSGMATSIGSLIDITECENTKEALMHSKEDFESLLNNLPDIFYRTNMEGVLTKISPSVKNALGFTPEEMIGKPLRDFYKSPEEREKIVLALKEGKGKAKHVEAWLRHKNGSPVWISTNAYIRLDENNEPLWIEGIARNRTDRKDLEERLLLIAKYDVLTKVFNRRAFLEEAEYQIDIARRYQHPIAMIMLDLDWFKTINDQFGHHVGDEALIYFAKNCSAVFRKTDIIGRMGGEEFAVIMPETEVRNAKDILERLRDRLKSQPLDAETEMITITFSAGIVALLEKDTSPETMLIRADQLLYQAKENGRNQIIIEN